MGGLGLAAASTEAGAAVVVGGYYLGGPLVHGSHGHVGRGFADLGIRSGAPLALGAIGFFAGGGGNAVERDDRTPGILAAIGVFLGMTEPGTNTLRRSSSTWPRCSAPVRTGRAHRR